MRKKIIGFALSTMLSALSFFSALLLALSFPAQAQQQAKVARIGWLGVRPAAPGTGRELLGRELRALGYVEGKNIAFEDRFADNKYDRLPALADELIRLKVNVLVTPGTSAALAVKNVTRTIPIVFFDVTDPVTAGLVDSLARPGGNITGFTTITAELAGKQLELLNETVAKLSRVAVLWNPQNPGNAQQWKESQLAAKNRLAAIYPRGDFVASGGLISYGPNRAETYRRAAYYVDRILKGAKPADLPVEQPTKFELVINLKAAKQIGLTIPPTVLARADKVIR